MKINLQVPILALSIFLGLPPLSPAADLLQVNEATARKSALTKVEPEYPAMARQMKVSGKVHLAATVDFDGNVTKTEVVEGHALLGSACSASVKKWKFKPFSDGAKASIAVVNLTFDFRI
jgi:TonB family protein